MTVKKNDLMHQLYGVGEGRCVDCRYLKTIQANKGVHRKCLIYGNTRSEATDWSKYWCACGLKNKETDICKVMLRVTQKNKEIPITGQIRMESRQ